MLFLFIRCLVMYIEHFMRRICLVFIIDTVLPTNCLMFTEEYVVTNHNISDALKNAGF